MFWDTGNRTVPQNESAVAAVAEEEAVAVEVGPLVVEVVIRHVMAIEIVEIVLDPRLVAAETFVGTKIRSWTRHAC